ncbi:unnamed protein product [Nippostrongylus brasiliensis]|uniref:SWIB domain-containing protein n=2 Tax=Nippostrongylus brasiliensis TaxID=27835 RepID=A0A0N4YRF8_NIPBR|nr:unnamed protein product [Nippostrongylus brasiliensis]
MSSSDEDTFPVERHKAVEAIEKMINEEGLEKLTSSKIRAYLSTTFNTSFDDFRKEVDQLTKEAIENREKSKAEESRETSNAGDKSGADKSNAASGTDSYTSDEGVVDDRRASSKKKRSLKRKTNEGGDDVDLMTAVKHRRRAAADKAAQILKKTADRTDRSKKKDKNAPKGDHSGKFGRMTKLCLLSEELQSIVGARFMKRCDVISKMWEYIRANNLLDPKDKRFCLVDDKLRGVFGPCKRFRAFSGCFQARQALADSGSAEASRDTASPPQNDDKEESGDDSDDASD